jgi:methionyl-tRNA synthetase
MQNEELEEKVTMLEELIQGFVTRMTVVETEMPEFLKTFLQQYKETLDRIASRIETANERYDDAKIQQQIDEVKKLVATVPKVIGVKTSHHFGAWSKCLIIGIVVCFVVTSLSVGTALYLNHQNDRLNNDAYNYWLVKALYPEVSKTIEKKLGDDPKGLNQQAEKEMEKQEAITAAQAQAEQADKEQKAAKDNLEKVKSGK